jgi:AraC-like DNA-binding protein
MIYKQYPVHPALQNWIRYFWSYQSEPSQLEHLHVRSFADCYPRLIFQDLSSFSPIRDADGNQMPICYISGLDTRPSSASWESRFSHFGVSFYPHALTAVFGLDATGLTNQMPDILELGDGGLTSLLTLAKDHQQRVSVLSKYFYDRLFSRKYDRIITDLIHQPLMNKISNDGNLGAIADHYRISERQLQRRFKQNIGVTASKYKRLQKFEKALQLVSSVSYGGLTGLSYGLGYADQSHFINDFKEFSGFSPYEFIKMNDLGSESASFIYKETSSLSF